MADRYLQNKFKDDLRVIDQEEAEIAAELDGQKVLTITECINKYNDIRMCSSKVEECWREEKEVKRKCIQDLLTGSGTGNATNLIVLRAHKASRSGHVSRLDVPVGRNRDRE